jgi:hypothetical protein
MYERDAEACALLTKYLRDKKFNIKDDLYDIEYIGNHITLRHSHHGNKAITVLSINDMKFKFGNNSCDPIDLHHPESFPEIVETLQMCLRYRCAYCRRHWSAFPGLKKRKP